jgi:hypothetical protein
MDQEETGHNKGDLRLAIGDFPIGLNTYSETQRLREVIYPGLPV